MNFLRVTVRDRGLCYPFRQNQITGSFNSLHNFILQCIIFSQCLRKCGLAHSRGAEQAEGVLVAGAPGRGKTTWAQAVAEYYALQNKIVKTGEAPRDLILPERITQYSISYGDSQEIHDILLLTRPDYTIFDEMRNTDDFKLFADLRLAGVGMVGVVHATSPVDAIQRFIGRVEMGVIPQVIDTVI